MAFAQSFDPLDFFNGRTEGAGIVTRGSKVVRRSTIETLGAKAEQFGALHFDERYVFDDGSPDDVMRWAICGKPAGALDAAEQSVLGKMRSKLEGPHWRVRFQRRLTPPSKGPIVTYDVRFCMISMDLVVKHVDIRLFGLPLAKLQAFHARM